MNRIALIAFALGLFGPAVAEARGRPSVACVDSFGTIIQGIKSPGACKKLGARWARPGSKSLPKGSADSGSKHHKRRRGGVREAQG